MHELELRISDVDRDRAAAALNKTVGEGRISWDEHAERLAAVYSARTGAELVPLLADLPGTDLPSSWVSTASMRPEAPLLQVTLGKVRDARIRRSASNESRSPSVLR